MGENSSLTLTNERKIKNITKLEVGQVWVVYPEQKKEEGVFVCILDVFAAGAYIVILHGEKQLRTGIEPLIVSDFYAKLELIAVVERTLSVSAGAFRGASCLGKFSHEQVSQITRAAKEFQRIFSDSSMLMYLEVHGPKDHITDELKAKAAKTALFLPIGGSVEELENLHFKLQSVVQRHHEKFIFGQ